MVRISRKPLFVACLSITALLATACMKIDGTPVAAELDVRKLEVGKYEVSQFSYDQDPGKKAALLEGFRMSEAVVPTVRIDSSLTHGGIGRATSDTADATDTALADVSTPVLDRNRMLAAYVVGGSDREPDATGETSVMNMVMRFPDAQAAKTAARELEDVDFNVAADINKKLTLSQYPDAYIHWRPGVPNIGTFMAYKEFVISLLVVRPSADEQDLLSWVRKTLDAQVPQLDKFTPTPESKFSSLKVDPDNLLSRVVVKDRPTNGKGTLDPILFAVYGPTKLVQNASNESDIQKAVTDSGADAVAFNEDSAVVRTRDAGGAQVMLSALVADESDHYDSLPAPNDVPGAKCVKLNSKGDTQTEYKNRCYVAYKRFIGVVSSDSESDVRQKIAAQYALLANSM
ncbi:DUF7373 family lipoprotein [Nocardia huaxiensis]|uniref:Uncharacterized protein n=1 Tax=Nocardia huaxiensis TaxID=2755382 RepID=A0A7D6VBZ7_9NOCA|nr:hypothetical protein [Nocardia huaxiensis]QLY31914.1 hypothetical protein H0264_06300 [Nocardia huaxiensis]UFS95478.1 hypothetical protein LPY97_33185 [Nocardia huaxiensis]